MIAHIQNRRDGFARPATWIALGVTLALHAIVLAAILLPSPTPTGRHMAEHVITLQLQQAPSPAQPPPPPAIRLTAPPPPSLHAPVFAITAPPAVRTAPQPASAQLPTQAATPNPNEALQRYAALVRARIISHRRPGLHRAGTVILRFTLDRHGRVISDSILRSSGDPLLDAVALASIRAAAPFPAPPPAIANTALTFTIPFEFS